MSESHAEKVLTRLEKDVFPWLGKTPVGEVKAPDLLSTLRRIESRGAIELTHVTKRVCGQIFRYAIATGRAERDPAADLKGSLQPVGDCTASCGKCAASTGQVLRRHFRSFRIIPF